MPDGYGSANQEIGGLMKLYAPFLKLGAAAAIIFAAWCFEGTFVAYVPAWLLVLWSFD